MENPKKIGVIGGMGSRAGGEFFNKLIEYSPALYDQEFPEIILHNNPSIPDRTQAIVYGKESSLPSILQSVKLMEKNNVDIIAMACITSYHYYKDVIQETSARVINPVSVVTDMIKKYYPGHNRVGVLATTGTLQSGLFNEEFDTNGLELVRLNKSDQEEFFMNSVYMENGLKSSNISQHAKDLMHASVSKLQEKGAQVIVGGCSEVQLVISRDNADFPFLDMIDLMAREVIRCSYGNDMLLDLNLVQLSH